MRANKRHDQLTPQCKRYLWYINKDTIFPIHTKESTGAILDTKIKSIFDY
jgi:hypothetical protein